MSTLAENVSMISLCAGVLNLELARIFDTVLSSEFRTGFENDSRDVHIPRSALSTQPTSLSVFEDDDRV